MTRSRTVMLWRGIRKNWGLYLLLLPGMTLLALFVYRPMYGILIAFKDYVPRFGILGSPWAGFKYFRQFFNSFQFENTISNTILISLYGLGVSFPLPIVVALCVNQMRVQKFRKVFQVATYLPHFISTVVLVGMMIIILSPTSGIVGNVARLMGVEPVNALGVPHWFRHIYIWSGVWQNTGWDSIIYLAALSAVDPQLYEAATVDGASKFQKMVYIDVPMLFPTMATLLILRSGNIMSVGFEKVYLMQNPLNLLFSEIISTYVYKIGLLNAQYSFSSAVNLFNNVINFILLVTVNQISKYVSNNSLW
ncbi:MAG: ABC transporter permease subunit [Oscillospiraceae bacterium]|nr:ABC transporter permease subunit [Oscillospiraceae bacterium]